jgi:hypothetical protein
MKKVLFFSIAAIMLSFSAPVNKVYVLKISEEELSYHWKNIEDIKKVIDQSSLPHTEAKQMIYALDSLQRTITKVTLDSTIVNKKK